MVENINSYEFTDDRLCQIYFAKPIWRNGSAEGSVSLSCAMLKK